ncbi:FeoB-associated Cys-rich membrane protein [Enterococcus sp. DIV0876]
MVATIIIGSLIFGYAARVVYNMCQKNSCSDCHCACSVKEETQKNHQA